MECTYVRMCVFMFVCMYVCMYICVYVFVYVLDKYRLKIVPSCKCSVAHQ